MKVYFGTVDREGALRKRIRELVKVSSDPLVVSEELRGYAYAGYDVNLLEYDTDLDFQQSLSWDMIVRFWQESDVKKKKQDAFGIRRDSV